VYVCVYVANVWCLCVCFVCSVFVCGVFVLCGCVSV